MKSENGVEFKRLHNYATTLTYMLAPVKSVRMKKKVRYANHAWYPWYHTNIWRSGHHGVGGGRRFLTMGQTVKRHREVLTFEQQGHYPVGVGALWL